MKFEGQQPFENTPLGAHAAEEERADKFTLETEDGFFVTADLTSHPDGTDITLSKNGDTTNFLVIKGELYNAKVHHYNKTLDSIDEKVDDGTLGLHAKKLLALIAADLIK